MICRKKYLQEKKEHTQGDVKNKQKLLGWDLCVHHHSYMGRHDKMSLNSYKSVSQSQISTLIQNNNFLSVSHREDKKLHKKSIIYETEKTHHILYNHPT